MTKLHLQQLLKATMLIMALTLFPGVIFSQNKNILTTSYSETQINETLITDHSWITFPDYQDRNAWNEIPADLRKQYIEVGEKYMDYDWPTLTATLYLEFIRSGNRDIMQNPYNERQRAFEALIMAELMEGKGRFIDAIVNGAFSICEQTYWGLSAHLTLQKAGAGLPDIDDPTIDLGVGKLAVDLAWAWYFFKEEFDKVHPLISKRIIKEIKDKVLSPYYEREDMWWMGFNTDFVNNWNPWCNYNVLNCIMLIESDDEVKKQNVYKTIRSVDRFLNYYKNDGGCDEGPGYWSHAGGKLFDYLELLYKITGGKVNVYNNEMVANMGRYIYRAYISGEYFTNFADASAKIHSRPGVIYRYGKRINDPVMSGFGAFLAKQHHFGDKPIGGKVELALENLFNLSEIKNAEPVEPLLKEFYLPETQLVGVRDKEGSRDGFYFAAKGGHNDESHNHNDVGSCLVYYNGQPVLIDVGVGTYTRKTFSSRRYEIWTMQSGYHNLPVINGIEQKEGKQYTAGESNFSSSSSKAVFNVEIAGAYPEDAKVKSWKRQYSLFRGKKLRIEDIFSLEENNGKTRLHFMTDKECVIVKPGIIHLKNDDFTLAMTYDPKMLSAKIDVKQIKDKRLARTWGDHINRIVLNLKSKGLSGKIKVDLSEKDK